MTNDNESSGCFGAILYIIFLPITLPISILCGIFSLFKPDKPHKPRKPSHGGDGWNMEFESDYNHNLPWWM